MRFERWLVGLVGVILAAGVFSPPGAARAQAEATRETAPAEAESSSDQQARLHFQVAAQYYQEADFESALREFQSAYRLSQRPQLLYNISLCQAQLGNLEESVSNLERYLAEVPDVENRPLLEQRLTNLRARRDRQRETGTDPGEDGAATGPETAPPPPASSGDSTNVASIAGFSIAGVGLVSAVIFSVLTLTEGSRLDGLPCARTDSCASAETGTIGTYALVADVSWGVSLVGAIVGTIFLFVPTGGGPSESTASLRVAPVLGGTNGLMLSGSF